MIYYNSDALTLRPYIKFTDPSCFIQSTKRFPANEKSYCKIYLVLCTYFPSARNEQIHLDTKYYLADVRIVRQGWPDASEIVLSEAEMS